MFIIDAPPLENALGFLALLSYVCTLTPSILRVTVPQAKNTKISKLLLKKRRSIGILAFLLAFCHGWLLINKRNIDFVDPKTSWIYFQGVATMIIFSLLAVTSNDWSVRKLKRNWKQLHRLTYLAMFLLTWHVWDKMSGHWTYITPVSMVAILAITGLFIIRLWYEKQTSRRSQKAPQVE